ncbi:hypothetical protein KC19_5G004300 [Ceratodon purpureus]|uniref:RING-type domain-containing protein n=1 Tax=Ceratodon purpureus TaxID=3225 RepID=A0A8T0HXP1_CERPU|nr:hypothetical protein KC19_5G004300 [Ceratodon purpureus]
MDGAAEHNSPEECESPESSSPEFHSPEECESAPALEFGLASRDACSNGTLENSSDSQPGVSSLPTPTSIQTPTATPTTSPSPAPSETDLSLGVAGQLESSCGDSDGQQDPSESPQEVASVSPKDLIQVGNNDIEVKNTLLSLQDRVRLLEIELNERNNWVQQKVMQATQAVSKERQELNALRAERDEALRFKKDQKALEESTLKRKAELETLLRKEKAEVLRLKNENAEVRAELQAAKLSAAESVATYEEAAKREKKGAKRAQGWEKQKAKLQEELSEEKRKLTQFQQVLAQAKERHLQAEVRWRQEEKAKEEAVSRADKEKRAKEQAESAFKRREEATRRKAEQDKQRLRDDVERLTQELSSLRAAESANLVTASWDSPVTTMGMVGGRFGLKEHERLARELAELQDSLRRSSALPLPRDRECVMCMSEEMSVVFLPCAHQVVCIECNELHEKKGMRDCPSCRTPIQQRIRVYGASC